tara:strand:- start:3029 stop:3796 length:768 start_codon:yes stop_codon:yes gene_type:complete
MEKKNISFQVYTARNFKPYEGILKFLSESGIQNIELFEVEAFDEIKDLLEKYNLTAKSSHIGFDTLKNSKQIISSLQKLNVKHAIIPCPTGKPGGKFEAIFDKNENEWNEFGKELSSYVSIFEDNGITLGYHNHAFEFNKLPSGKMPIECILDHNEKLKYEIDLGWVVAGKADPIYWTKKYSSRIIACHLKDFSSPEKDLISHDSQCAVGDGFIDWSSLLDEVKKTDCEIFALEHDNPNDYKDYILKSINNLINI